MFSRKERYLTPDTLNNIAIVRVINWCVYMLQDYQSSVWNNVMIHVYGLAEKYTIHTYYTNASALEYCVRLLYSVLAD